MKHSHLLQALLGAALLPAFFTAPAFATDPAIKVSVVAIEGQTVTGVGNITSISTVAVNNLGETLVEVDTDNPLTDMDGAMLRNGTLYIQEGQALALPAGASVGSFDTVNLNNLGDSGWNFFLDGTTGSSDDSGIFLNTSLLIQESSLATAPQFSPGTPFLGFFECKINDAGQILVLGTADDPAIASTVDQFLMTLDTFGNQSVYLKEGDQVPGAPGVFVSTFGTTPHNFDYNNAGDVLCFIDSDAATTVDGFIVKNGTIIAREGDPAPVTGRNWSSLSSPELSLNDQGGYVFSGSLDGDSATNLIIVRNGDKFRQEGDTLPAFAPFLITSFGSAPILAANATPAESFFDVFWYADWDDPDTTKDTGLFLDEKLLLQEGVDKVGGIEIEDLRGIQDGYAISDNGRYLIVRLNLVGSIDAAAVLDMGPWENLGNSLAGTTTPKLRCFGQLAPSQPVTLRLSNALPGAFSALLFGLTQVNQPFRGGILVPTPQTLVYPLPVNADGVLELTANWPAAAPAGVDIYMQYWVADPGAPAGYAASNAVVGTSQ